MPPAYWQRVLSRRRPLLAIEDEQPAAKRARIFSNASIQELRDASCDKSEKISVASVLAVQPPDIEHDLPYRISEDRSFWVRVSVAKCSFHSAMLSRAYRRPTDRLAWRLPAVVDTHVKGILCRHDWDVLTSRQLRAELEERLGEPAGSLDAYRQEIRDRLLLGMEQLEAIHNFVEFHSTESI